MDPTVLCIAENPPKFSELVEKLRGYGDRILTATSHPQAIAIASIEHIDVIILFLESLNWAYSTPASLKFVQPRAMIVAVTLDRPGKSRVPAEIDAVAHFRCTKLPQLIQDLSVQSRKLDTYEVGRKW